MNSPLVLSITGTFFMLPAALAPWAPKARQGWSFWLNLVLAALWAAVVALRLVGYHHWSAALADDLWVTIAATLLLFLLVCFRNGQARRLLVLVMPYLLFLAVLACFSSSQAEVSVSEEAPAGWIGVHILVSVTTLGLLTLAATAALACFIQARALKNKQPNALSRLLPAVSDSEKLYEGLLIVSEIVLAAGVATGMATEFAETGRLLVFDHKTLFSLLAFALIGGLIAGRRWGGVRGQMAERLMLVAYSFVLLGYFGVKFVKQVLLS
jgi:ABC-type uncharacterized transport system permease subunit